MLLKIRKKNWNDGETNVIIEFMCRECEERW